MAPAKAMDTVAPDDTGAAWARFFDQKTGGTIASVRGVAGRGCRSLAWGLACTLLVAGIMPGPAFAIDPVPPPRKPHPSVIQSIFDGPPPQAAVGVVGGLPAGSWDAVPQGDGGLIEDGAIEGRSVSLAMRPLPGLPVPPGVKPAPPRPDAASLIAAAGFQPSQVGFLAVDLDTGEVIAEHNAHRAAFLPASVMKVPTTVAALQVLGPDHRFRTEVRFSGRRGADGVWSGTLALVGGGDPLLDARGLEALATDLKRAGLRRLDGTFVYDDSLLTHVSSLDASQPPEYAYNPGLSALSLDFNRIRVQWRGESVSLVEMHGTPPVAPVILRRDQSADGWTRPGPWVRHDDVAPGTAVTPAGDPVVERWRLSPQVAKSGARWLPVHAPAPFTASVFRALAKTAGVTLPPGRPADGAARGPVVVSHASPPLSVITKVGLKYSNNLLAELVGLSTSRALVGQALDMETSAAVVRRWLTDSIPWVDWSGFVMANHSGLSSASRASPDQIVAILRFALEHPAGGQVRYDSLLPQRSYDVPEAGWRPVAASVHAGGVAPKVWAKTGTMYHGRGLAGLAEAASGHRLVFALFTSDLAARRAFDDGYLHYSASAVARAKAALGRARDLEHALVLSWIVAH